MDYNPIQTDASNAFAYVTMHERLPNSLLELIAINDLTTFQEQSLRNLRQSMMNNDPLPEPNYLAPDAAIWIADFEAHRGETWLNAEWFFSEMMYFREIINRVQYWQTGIDPYLPMKTEELYSDSLQKQLLLALEVDASAQENLHAMLQFALWGNRADLSLPEAMAHGQVVGADDLLIDDRGAAVETLLNRDGDVHLITDNFGTELAMDFALIYHLLKLDMPVVVHVKMNPTYVSDATASDMRWMLAVLPEIHSKFVALVETMQSALGTGQLRVQPDFFWNSSRYYPQLPDYLHMAFSQARVIISKGDANYRRALYDTFWSVDDSFSEIMAAIPAPFLALRTLKSDPIVGLSVERSVMLDAEDKFWRVNGKRGVIQFTG